MKVAKMTFFIKCLLASFFLIIFSINEVKANEPMDAILSDYIDEIITNSELIESDFQANAFEVTNRKKNFTESITNDIQFSVYTFKNNNGKEPIYDTFIDYQFLTPMKVKGYDKFTLNVGDAIGPISPITGLMYSKSTADAEWTFAKESIPIINSLQGFTIEGEQLRNADDYTRLIIHFTSVAIKDLSRDEIPTYEIRYDHDPGVDFSHIEIPWIVVILSVILLVVLIFLLFKRKSFRKSDAIRSNNPKIKSVPF